MVIAGGNAQSSACAGDTLFAAVGDVHGEMHAMVSLAESWEAQSGLRISFVLQTGDFEPHRHETDLQTMAAPSKHKRVGDFPDFAAGSSSFPWPVYFIGGNHEPYGFLDQHPQGAQIAHNCHYLGRVALTVLSGLRVVSLTGIYREKDYSGKRPPVDSLGTISNKVFASFNETDIDAALSYDHADVLVMHDWPADIVHPEDLSKVQAQCRRLRFATWGTSIRACLSGFSILNSFCADTCTYHTKRRSGTQRMPRPKFTASGEHRREAMGWRCSGLTRMGRFTSSRSGTYLVRALCVLEAAPRTALESRLDWQTAGEDSVECLAAACRNRCQLARLPLVVHSGRPLYSGPRQSHDSRLVVGGRKVLLPHESRRSCANRSNRQLPSS